jgi:hypothetical protein
MTFEESLAIILDKHNKNTSNNVILKKLIVKAYYDEWNIESKSISNKMRIIKIDENGCIQI